jgi:hypothetical protein
MNKQVKIVVDPKGVLTVTAEGFQGVSCKDATKVFESLGTMISSSATPDMYTHDQIEGVEISNACI